MNLLRDVRSITSKMFRKGGRRRTISIVINTCDRRESLQRTLESLPRQTYRDFEVIVVNGPSEDGTDVLLRAYGRDIKVGSCPERRLGLSRNIGIDLAAGEIVAFLDDDAVPEDDWLEKLAKPYDTPDVAAVGGYVFDVPLGRVEYRLCTCTRTGDAVTDAPAPAERYLGPGADPFLYLAGCNMSFRRSVLVEIGGFNDAFIYGYDDVDVCARVIDAGYRITVLEDAIVRHYRAANSVRDGQHTIRDIYPMIHARAVFALQGRGADDRIDGVLAELSESAMSWHSNARHMHHHGDLTQEAYERFRKRIDDGLRDGIETGMKPRPIRGFHRRPPNFRPLSALAPAR